MHKRVSAVKCTRLFIPQRALPIPNLYDAALRHHCAGGLYEAERGYREILSIDSCHADSLHLLGVIGHQTGNNQAAEAMIRKAIGLNGKSPDYHCNLGCVLQALDRQNEAVTSYQNALALAPCHSKAHNNLGNALLALGRAQEAIAHYAQVLDQCPRDADAQNNMGNALSKAGKPLEAIACYENALAINENHFQACFNLGCVFQELGELDRAMACYQQAVSIQPDHAQTHNNLGNVLQALKKPDEAITCYKRAISIQPGYAEAYNNLGNVLREQEKLDAALACYVSALTLKHDYLDAAIQCSDTLRELGRLEEAAQLFEQVINVVPENAEVQRNFGDALRKLGKLAAAEEHCKRAIALAPTDADAHLNLGNALYDAGKVGEAIRCYKQAIALRPEHAISKMNLAIAQLKSGDLLSGWKNYEWRWNQKLARGQKREFVQPLWRGEPIQGRRILLYGEQGLGDCIQFLRYVPMVHAAGGKIVLEIPCRLKRLVAQLPGIEESVAFGDLLPSFDWQCPLVSLPLVFGTDLDSIPGTAPYLKVPSDACQKAQSYPWPSGALRVGLAWAGNPRNQNDKFRSMPFACFQTLSSIQGLSFFSLQLGEALEQLTQSGAPVTDLAPLTADMADTAAFIANLDLVITVDTSIAHLAGALAKPVWILLASNADWRWMAEREDSPWYPTARLFRQSALGDWNGVMDRVVSCLTSLLASQANDGSSAVFHRTRDPSRKEPHEFISQVCALRDKISGL
jgi:tetratricopeptide (TPR) repeat protein